MVKQGGAVHAGLRPHPSPRVLRGMSSKALLEATKFPGSGAVGRQRRHCDAEAGKSRRAGRSPRRKRRVGRRTATGRPGRVGAPSLSSPSLGARHLLDSSEPGPPRPPGPTARFGHGPACHPPVTRLPTVGPLLPARLPRCHVSRLPRVQRELLGVTPLPPRDLGRPTLPPHALVHRAGCNPPCTTPHSSWPGELHLPGLRGAWTRGSLLPSEMVPEPSPSLVLIQ